jgi:hypothetical protein
MNFVINIIVLYIPPDIIWNVSLLNDIIILASSEIDREGFNISD